MTISGGLIFPVDAKQWVMPRQRRQPAEASDASAQK
jgi:hypothetical protein